MVVLGGISGFCPKILPEIENFGGSAPPPFCQTPYKTLKSERTFFSFTSNILVVCSKCKNTGVPK